MLLSDLNPNWKVGKFNPNGPTTGDSLCKHCRRRMTSGACAHKDIVAKDGYWRPFEPANYNPRKQGKIPEVTPEWCPIIPATEIVGGEYYVFNNDGEYAGKLIVE